VTGRTAGIRRREKMFGNTSLEQFCGAAVAVVTEFLSSDI